MHRGDGGHPTHKAETAIGEEQGGGVGGGGDVFEGELGLMEGKSLESRGLARGRERERERGRSAPSTQTKATEEVLLTLMMMRNVGAPRTTEELNPFMQFQDQNGHLRVKLTAQTTSRRSCKSIVHYLYDGGD